jgi:4-amino-4-deoxy-L-arabinose transferase-like glycosyltransferase
MEVDSAQYYSMAVEMLKKGEFLEFTDRGKPYLDKPPFIFWISGLFFSLFGISEFAFKLPSILFSVIGIYSCYRLARLYYSRETAQLAALILATTQGYYHFNNDVRTDTYLTNSVIASVWLIAEFLSSRKLLYCVGGFFFAGIAMLAKGPMGLVSPILAFGTHILLKANWRVLWRWEWLVGICVTGLVISPMLIGLYRQFDLHPELIVNGKTGISGLRFYFWEQSFGRITGENVWRNDTGPFFFVHNLAWSFLPWSIGIFGAFFLLIKHVMKQPLKLVKERAEWISWGGFLLPFIALSFSKYKLPHYIYVTFPFAAVIAADYFIRLKDKSDLIFRRINIVNYIVLGAAWLFALLIVGWFFPLRNWLLILVAFVGIAGLIWSGFYEFESPFKRFLFISLLCSFSVNAIMAAHFYPSILEYQASGKAGAFALEHKLPLNRLFVLETNARALDVYTEHVQTEVDEQKLQQIWERDSLSGLYVFTNKNGLERLRNAGWTMDTLFKAPAYSVTILTMNFGNPNTREKVLNRGYIFKLSK